MMIVKFCGMAIGMEMRHEINRHFLVEPRTGRSIEDWMFGKYERVPNEDNTADLLLTVTQGGVRLERYILIIKNGYKFISNAHCTVFIGGDSVDTLIQG